MEEIKKKIDEVLENITKAQKRIEEVGQKADKTDGEFKVLADNAAKALEEIQAIKQKQVADEEARKLLEKQLFRSAGSAESKAIDELKAKNEFTKFLRRGSAMSEESTKYVVKQMIENSFIGVDEDQKEYAIKALLSGVNPQGGYFIRPELSDKVITQMFETSPMRELADVVTTSSDMLEMIIDDNEATSGGWVGETGTRSETATPDIGLLSIPVHELYAQPKASQRMLDDAGFDVEGWLTRKVTTKLSRVENTAFVSGSGSSQPKGVLSYTAWSTPGTYERNKIEQVASGTSGEVTAAGLISTQNALKEEYQANATWLMKRATFGSVVALKSGTGEYLVNPRLLAEGANKVVLGNPVRFANDMATIAGSSLSIAYGDFKQGYTIVDRYGFRVIRDEYSSKPYILLYTTKRTGGAVTNYEAIKINKLST